MKEKQSAYEPSAPSSLVGALQDRPHQESGGKRGLTRSGLRTDLIADMQKRIDELESGLMVAFEKGRQQGMSLKLE